MKYFLLSAFLILAFSSCKQKPAEENQEAAASADLESLEAEIMKVHDEAMPKISDINRLSSQVRDIKNKAGVDADGNPIMVEGLDPVLEELRKVEQGMMDWMRNYSEVKDTLSPAHLEGFYQKELDKIRNVQMEMESAIENANNWLTAHPAG